MLKRIRSKYVKVLIVLAIIAMIAFIVVSGIWAVYYYKCCKPMLNAMNRITDIESEEYKESEGVYYHFGADFDDHFEIFVPRFLKYGCNFQAITPTLYDENNALMTECTYYIYFEPKLFGDDIIEVRVSYYENVSMEYATGENSDIISNYAETVEYCLCFDKDMNLISGDEQIFKKNYEGIKERFDCLYKYIGEDYFE